MSKVKNITKSLIPYLNELFGEKLLHLSNTWFLDNNENLYKLLLFEDGYLISNDSEYPEELEKLPKNNSFKNLNIYLEKVTRNKYVSTNQSLFKFTFTLKNSIYHYVFTNLLEEMVQFNNLQIDSRKRKRSYSEEEIKTKKKYKKVDWSQMVSASRVRNFLLNDTLIDWLNEYNVSSLNMDLSKHIPNSASSVSTFRENDNIDEFTKHIMEQGNIFEKEVIKLLSKKVKIVQASESFQAKEIHLCCHFP